MLTDSETPSAQDPREATCQRVFMEIAGLGTLALLLPKLRFLLHHILIGTWGICSYPYRWWATKGTMSFADLALEVATVLAINVGAFGFFFWILRRGTRLRYVVLLAVVISSLLTCFDHWTIFLYSAW